MSGGLAIPGGKWRDWHRTGLVGEILLVAYVPRGMIGVSKYYKRQPGDKPSNVETGIKEHAPLNPEVEWALK